MMKKFGKYLFASLVFLFFVSYSNVFAENCTQFEIIDGGFPVASITVNGEAWTSEDDQFEPNGGNYEIIILAGKKEDKFPDISRPGGLGEVERIVNPDSTGEDDKYKLTLTITDYNDGACVFIGGFSLIEGSEPQLEKHEETASVTITIKGEELEYHYVEDKPNEADVTYFKFDINGGTEEERLVPFTFGNAEYTHNDKEPPKNVTQVTTKSPIQYKYLYDGSGKVEFCVNGGGTDEYTSIKINGVEYAKYAPHTKEAYWEAMNGWAQMFCIPDVPYSPSYEVIVEGQNTADENKIPGFGWSYLTKERSTDIDEEGNFAHGRLEFVSASLVIDGEEEIFGSARSFDNYRYKGKGQIFQWSDGQKEYPEEDRRLAWGEAQMPYGTTLRVRIVPDEGYQLTSLAVNENGFKPTETPGEYELTLTRTNLSYNEDNNQFDLNPKFEKVDATATTDATAVSNVVITINKGENAFETGTPKLEVTDVASMSSERENEFDKATEEGFTINNYLEISLYNTLYKGGKKDGDKLASWDTEVHELEGKATIGLELEDELDGEEVQVIHEVRDDDNKIVGYDVLDAEYDKDTKTVTFETDGFSTYAIAVKGSSELPDEEEEEPEETVKVDFDTRAPKGMDPVNVKKGEKIVKPADPVNGDLEFVGWFIDENYENEFDFNTPITKDMVLYAKWNDKIQEYTVKDDNGNSIQFKEIKDRSYDLTIIDVTKLSDEELSLIGATREEYNEVEKLILKATSKEGELIAVYQIEVIDKEDDHSVVEGPFKIKIKLTDDMKKYNTFKMIYLNDDFEAEDVIELEVEGDYLVGTLPHLSIYTLVGNFTLPDVPKTGDSINTWIIVFIVSMIALSLSTTYVLKTKKVRINK